MSDAVIVRLPNWLGDTVMAVPALRALREHCPKARMLVAGPWASILLGQELADVIVTYPRAWSGRVRTADIVRDFHGDLALVLPNSFESAVMARYAGARQRVGFAVGGRSWLLTDAVPMPAPRRHQVDEYRYLVERIGIRSSAREPRLVAPDRTSGTRGEIRERLRRIGIESGRQSIVGIHLGAAYGAAKLWPVTRVIELCREVSRDGAVPLLLGTRDSCDVAVEITRATEAASLVGGDSPELLLALLTEIDGLIGGDTGVTHLAAALGTPVVTLFGPTDPALSAPRGPAAVIRHPVPCSPCFYRTCPIDHPCMQSIDAREVHDRLWALVSETRR